MTSLMEFEFDENLRKSVKRMRLMAKRMAEETLIGNYRSRFKGIGLNFSDLRQYVSGDDIRHIHWKATARSGKIFIKTYEEERQLSVFLVVDESASMLCGGAQSTYQKALDLSALISFLCQTQNDLVGLLKFNREISKYVTPSNKRNNYSQILSALVSVPQAIASSDLSLALEVCKTRLKKRNLIFVVSDFFASNYEGQLKSLSSKHDVVFTLIKPPLPPEGLGLLKMYASESGEEFIFDSSSRKARKAIEKSMLDHSAKVREIAIKAGADFLEVSDEPVKSLRSFMLSRSKKK